jgi:acyl-CoA synthetase (AMP-forming)/AMP-acid ligase II
MRLVSEFPGPLAESVLAVIDAARTGRAFPLVTSGATGAPKTLERDLAAALARKAPGKPTEKWLLTYSPKRWAGVSLILHALKVGGTLCVPRSLAPEDILESARAYGVTHISLTPSMFRSLLITDKAAVLPAVPIEQVTFGGEAATQSVLDLARRTWSGARVTHVYASTELGDIWSVSDGLEGVPAHKVERFTLTEGGELVVHGHRTGDIWEKRGARYYFVGRMQELINVGGNKVSPLAVEEFAIRCGARFARAFAIPSALLGSVVGLEYVGDVDAAALARSFREELPRFMCPAQITRAEEISLSAAGKNRRLA